MELRPIRTKKIYEEIVEQIKELIRDGNLKPGDRIMSERDLASSLNVSRAAVREALSALEAIGLLEVKPGEGTFVCHTQNAEIIETLSMLLFVEQDTPHELIELRKILEMGGAQLAARRREPKHLKLMKIALQYMESELENGRNGDEADLKFHFSVAEASGNSLLMRMMSTIADTIQYTLKASRENLLEAPSSGRKFLVEHKKIFEAILRKNELEAQKAMLQHLEGIEDLLPSSEGSPNSRILQD